MSHWKCQHLGQELGYIVPEIVPEEDMKFPGWTTEIRLPFKPELGNEEKAVLEQDFQALDGTLLLNLNKLRPGFLLGLFLGGCILLWTRGECGEVFGASAMQLLPALTRRSARCRQPANAQPLLAVHRPLCSEELCRCLLEVWFLHGFCCYG